MPWLEKETKKQYLSFINDELFTQKISELTLEYLMDNEYVLNYFSLFIGNSDLSDFIVQGVSVALRLNCPSPFSSCLKN